MKNESENHTLSVIIPVYNDAEWLEECLQSVSKQELDGLEIICVDDGSTDSSPMILKSFAEKDKRFRILSHEKNCGILAARKTGIKAAVGDYIQFVDSDDIIDLGLCSCIYELIREKQTEILEFSARIINVENGRIIDQNPLLESLPKELFPDYIILPLWHYIIKRDLCMKTYCAIPNIICNKHEDIFTCFFLAYFANSYAGIRTVPKYNYYYGRGITVDSTVSLDLWKYYCASGNYYQIISVFLQQEKASADLFQALDRMSFRLLDDCYRKYALFTAAEKPKATEMFIEGWRTDPNFLLWLMDNLEKNVNDSAEKSQIIIEKNAALDQIYKSESWKVGNFLIYPIHVIKSLAISILKTTGIIEGKD